MPVLTGTAPDKTTHRHQEIIQHGDQIDLVIMDNEIEYAIEADPLRLANTGVPKIFILFEIEVSMSTKMMLSSLHKLRYLPNMHIYKFFGGRVGEKLATFVKIVNRLLDSTMAPLMMKPPPLEYRKN